MSKLKLFCLSFSLRGGIILGAYKFDVSLPFIAWENHETSFEHQVFFFMNEGALCR